MLRSSREFLIGSILSAAPFRACLSAACSLVPFSHLYCVCFSQLCLPLVRQHRLPFLQQVRGLFFPLFHVLSADSHKHISTLSVLRSYPHWQSHKSANDGEPHFASSSCCVSRLCRPAISMWSNSEWHSLACCYVHALSVCVLT